MLYVINKEEKENMIKRYEIVICLVMNPRWIPNLEERAKYIVQKRYMATYKEKHPDILFIIDGTGGRLLSDFEKLMHGNYVAEGYTLQKINLEIYVMGQIYRRTDEFHTTNDQHSFDHLENWITEVKKSVIPLLPQKIS
uniref:Uncharacterized protein n=1 Tax=Acrobeloides nanus TaxID=290746 RepID=A0A914BUY4_9BILA